MKEKDFEKLPVNKLFLKVAIPSLISMLFANLYMISDGIFLGQFIGSQALAAVNIVMPIVMIFFALADMIAVGSAVKISIALGSDDKNKAKQIFTVSAIAIEIIAVFIAIITFIVAKPIIFNLIKDEL